MSENPKKNPSDFIDPFINDEDPYRRYKNVRTPPKNYRQSSKDEEKEPNPYLGAERVDS